MNYYPHCSSEILIHHCKEIECVWRIVTATLPFTFTTTSACYQQSASVVKTFCRMDGVGNMVYYRRARFQHDTSFFIIYFPSTPHLVARFIFISFHDLIHKSVVSTLGNFLLTRFQHIVKCSRAVLCTPAQYIIIQTRKSYELSIACLIQS